MTTSCTGHGTTGGPAERTHFTLPELAEMTLREIATVRVQTPRVWERTLEALDESTAR